MPKKATEGKTVILAVRMTPEQVQRVDALVNKGSAPSRTDFVKDAIQLKIYIEENRVATFTITSKSPESSPEYLNKT